MKMKARALNDVLVKGYNIRAAGSGRRLQKDRTILEDTLLNFRSKSVQTVYNEDTGFTTDMTILCLFDPGTKLIYLVLAKDFILVPIM